MNRQLRRKKCFLSRLLIRRLDQSSVPGMVARDERVDRRDDKKREKGANGHAAKALNVDLPWPPQYLRAK